MTLVDCPGHASLIRTIIGGAQIIDMVLLVVDAFKGWQAQTTECLVLAELTSPHLVVALNKIDMFPDEEREQKLQEAKNKVKARLKNSKFPNAPMVGISACKGGEKVAATNNDNATNNKSKQQQQHHQQQQQHQNATYNIDTLITTLRNSLPPPKRETDSKSPFYFAIDHCFPIKGMGTVLTGTVLHGSASVNDPLEFPTLGLERKIKSMQMFKRKTQSIAQGDRAGICVSSLDSTLLERGVAATPGAVQWVSHCIALVRKIPQYPSKIPETSKFHVSVGHTTTMATVTVFGANELLLEEGQRKPESEENKTTDKETSTSNNNSSHKKAGTQLSLQGSSLLGGTAADRAGLPSLKFDWNQAFLQQTEGYLEHNTKNSGSSSSSNSPPLLHWAFVEFQSPVYCPLNSLVIGSRLDTTNNNARTTTASDTAANNHKSGDDLINEAASSCRLAFCGRLLESSTAANKNATAKDIKKRLRLYTPKERKGVVSRLGDPHKRQDDGAIVRYELFGGDLFKKETPLQPFLGLKVVTPQGDIGELKSAFGTSGKVRIWFPAGTQAREGDELKIPFRRFLHDPEKKMRQDNLVLPKARPGSRLQQDDSNNKKKKKQKPKAVGQVEKVKGDAIVADDEKTKNGQRYKTAIVSGFFTPEINVREKVGQKVVVPATKEVGRIVGAFGKAGKCKVDFDEGISESAVGTKAELYETS